MAAQELNLLIQTVAQAITSEIELTSCPSAKYEVWLRFVRLGPGAERPVMPARKLLIEAQTPKELIYATATEVVLAVYGAEVTVVDHLPNLILRLLDKKGLVHLPGAPPLDEAEQIFLKVKVSRYQPGLWQQLFGGSGKDEG